jgi:YidC/Oxa1 family membrane protein insertase
MLSNEQPTPALDKQSCTMMALLMAAVFGYYTFIWYPQQVEAENQYQAELAEWHERNPGNLPGQVAPVGSGQVAPVGSSGSVAGVDSGVIVENNDPPPPRGNPNDDAIVFQTGEHDVVLSTRGASVQHLTLRNVMGSVYRPSQSAEADKAPLTPFEALHPYVNDVHSFAIEPTGGGLDYVAKTDWRHETVPGGGHRFSLTLENGLVLTKTYLPPVEPAASDDPDDETQRLFHFRLRVEVRNASSVPKTFGYHLNGPAGMVEQEVGRSSYGIEYALANRGEDGKTIELESSSVMGFESIGSPDEKITGPVHYFGTVTKYFTAVVIPVMNGKSADHVAEASSMGLVQYGYRRQPTDSENEGFDAIGGQSLPRGLVPEFELAPNERQSHDYLLYVGPRQEIDIFEQPVYEHLQLEDLVYFGWGIFGSFARLLMWILGGIFAVVGNWGVAILLLTFMVRGLMLPLSMWSQKNMFRMQHLAPEITKLKDKFSKPDGTMSPEQQRSFQQAQMDLWRNHGVNPVGCIGPMFLQMPIFIGLYNALNYSVAMRHSSFMLWFTDLSTPDIIWRMPFDIPIMDTNALSVLPLLMVGTYLMQQKVQPKAADAKAAEQQKIMKFVFPIFGLLFYTMPSGLMLYFITSSLWGIGEQLTIKKKIKADEEAKLAKQGKGKKDKKDDKDEKGKKDDKGKKGK